MKILHLCYWDKAGGASIAAYRLHHAFLQEGFDSTMLVFRKSLNEPEIKTINNWKTRILLKIFLRLSSVVLSKYRSYLGNFSINNWGLDISRYKEVQSADVIYIHWVNNSMVSIKGISRMLRQGKKVLWFLHDMYALTGGCHHSLSCQKYANVCAKCELLNSSDLKDIAWCQYQMKKKYLTGYQNLIFVAPSSWLERCTRDSSLFKEQRIVTIPNSIDISEFLSTSKLKARSMLTLPEDKRIILYGADQGEANPYKGWSYLKNAISVLPHKKTLLLLTFGGKEGAGMVEGIEYRSLGRITDNKILSLVYSSSDVFVVPSLAEAFGQTIIECMSAGTPVVGFKTGGIVDIVQHLKNGYLAEYRDSISLRDGIEWCIENRDKISKYCSEDVARRYNTLNILKLHTKLLSELR